MCNSEDKIKELLDKLNSNNSEVVLESVEKLREYGNKIVTLRLIDLLNENRNEKINGLATAFLNDIKDKESRIVFIEAIRNQTYNNIMYILVSACWQNGMDFSEYLSDFVDVIITSDYTIAFEAFTVIEEMEGIFKNDFLNEQIVKLKDAAIKADDNKQILLSELINMIESW